MRELETPITAGAQYQDTDGQLLRVKSVWVDEDKTTWVQVFSDCDSDSGSPKMRHHESLMLNIVITRIQEGLLKRTNTDHQAWEWRQSNPR